MLVEEELAEEEHSYELDLVEEDCEDDIAGEETRPKTKSQSVEEGKKTTVLQELYIIRAILCAPENGEYDAPTSESCS